MDRFPQTTFPNAFLAHRRGDDDASSSVAVLTCENCGRGVERLTLVPGFNYQGCDDCMAEALAVIAAEVAAEVCPQPEVARIGNLTAAGLTPAEVRAFTRLVAGEVA